MQKSRWILIACALLVIATGVAPVLDALEVFPGSAARMNAPRWVVLLAGGLFVMAGMYVLLLGATGEAAARSFGTVVGVALFAGLAAIVHWIAFGGGDRSDCSGGISALGVGFSSSVPDLECRAAFGYGALLMDGIFLRGIAWWAARRVPASKTVRALEKTAEWSIGLLLLPLILLALSLTALKEGGAKLAAWLRSRGPGHPPSS